jgi:hypothetical protein
MDLSWAVGRLYHWVEAKLRELLTRLPTASLMDLSLLPKKVPLKAKMSLDLLLELS